MNRWEEALDAQLEAYLFAIGDRGQRYLKGWTAAAAERSQKSGDPDGKRYAKWMRSGHEDIPQALYNADTVYISPEMQTLWEAACEDFEEEPLHVEDLTTDVGFAYFSKPHRLEDIHDKAVTHRAYLWHRITDGIVLFLLHRVGDLDDYDDGTNLQAIQVLRADGSVGIASVLNRGDLIVDGMYPWPFGGSPHMRGEDEPGTPMSHDTQVLFRLMQQTITSREQERPRRPLRRRLERGGLPERNITVVRLRRPRASEDGPHEPRPVEWTHRWLTRGHWRWQPYPSLGPDVRKQIWISPYIKGPADKPLELRKATIFELVR